MSYDKSVDALEKIVEKLSEEKLGVEESLELYSKGITLAKEAMNELTVFKGKIELLNKDLTQLEAETENGDDNYDE